LGEQAEGAKSKDNSGFLHCAPHDETVRRFGRNDIFRGFGRRKTSNDRSKGKSRSLRDDNKKSKCNRDGNGNRYGNGNGNRYGNGNGNGNHDGKCDGNRKATATATERRRRRQQKGDGDGNNSAARA